MSIFSRDWRICSATGCNRSRYKTQILCMEHWASLPRFLKLEVYNAVGSGGEFDIASRKAINYVEVAEGHITTTQANILEENIRERVRRGTST